MKDKKKRKSVDVTVKITLDDGKTTISCNPVCAYVSPGDTISWQCAKGLVFAIHLGYGSPFDKIHHHQEKGKLKLSIPPGKLHYRVKYTVAVSNGYKVWIEDPEIIIRGTGG